MTNPGRHGCGETDEQRAEVVTGVAHDQPCLSSSTIASAAFSASAAMVRVLFEAVALGIAPPPGKNRLE